MHARIAVAAALLAAAPSEVTVKREGARLMKAPRFFGEACREEVRPRQKVKVVEQKAKWARLESPGAGACWLHESAWLDKTPGELVGDPSKASQKDVELAGRGFSEGEEQKYRADHADLAAGFKIVDDYLA